VCIKKRERNPLSRKPGFSPVLHWVGGGRERPDAGFFLFVNINDPTTNGAIK